MNKVTTSSGKPLSPIGIGTWGIGGRGHMGVELTNVKEDSVYINALVKTLQMGYNFSEIALGYGSGKSAQLLAQGIKESGVNRTDLFLTNSLYPKDLEDFEAIQKSTEEMQRIFDTSYFDSTLVTQSLVIKFGYDVVVKKLKELLDTGKTRYVSLSNSNKDMIKQFKEEFKDKLFAHETHVSFEIRLCQDEGIFDLCNDLDIQTIIWRPLRQGMTITHDWEPLVRLSKKYGKTQNQIVLNWMKSQGFKPEVFSTSENHIRENWEAMQFEMMQEDYDELTSYRIPGYTPPQINWANMGNGDSIVPPIMGFEEDYLKK